MNELVAVFIPYDKRSVANSPVPTVMHSLSRIVSYKHTHTFLSLFLVFLTDIVTEILFRQFLMRRTLNFLFLSLPFFYSLSFRCCITFCSWYHIVDSRTIKAHALVG